MTIDRHTRYAQSEKGKAAQVRYRDRLKDDPERLAKRCAKQRAQWVRRKARKQAEAEAGGPEAVAKALEARREYDRMKRARERVRKNPGMTLDEAIAIGLHFQAEKDRRAAERKAFVDKAKTTGRRPDETRYQYKLRLNREGVARRMADPARREQEIAARKARDAKRKASRGDRYYTSEQYARVLETQRIRRAKAAEARDGQLRLHGPRPTGSVLVTAAPGPWRDMLADIGRLVPRVDDREDVIAEAALLVVQGVDVAEAVAQAKRKVNREAGPYRYMKPLEDCHWI